MKDITSTTFGLLIAFLLPGMVGLLAMSYWIPSLQDVFQTFNSAQSNVGLFLLVVLLSIALSLQLTILRWLLFEVIICRKNRLLPEDFSGLAIESKLNAFRAAVDEHYRYHQFWGSLTIVIPFFIVGWGLHEFPQTNLCERILFWTLSGSMEILTAFSARQAYINYVHRSRNILLEVTMPNGWDKDKEESSKRERVRELERPPKRDTSREQPPRIKPPREKPKKEK